MSFSSCFRSFVFNFADVCRPITDLLKKDKPFTWGPEQNLAFQKIKSLLLSAPVLKYPDFSQKFYLFTDASQKAIGGVLMQKEGDKLKPISYISRALSKTETRYSVTKKEALAIVH